MKTRGKIVYYPIFHDPKRDGSERSDKVRRWVEQFLIPAGLATMDESKANAYLVATGDGGLMRVAHERYQCGKAIVGVNCGRLGFLLNPVNDITELPQSFEELTLFKLKLFKATFVQRDQEQAQSIVFNDVVVGCDISDFIAFKIRGEMNHFPERKVTGTGLVISAPQGTTGYALKARGSMAVLPLEANNWFIAGIATGPYPCDVVTPQTITIEMESRNKINGYADGKSFKAEDIRQLIIEPSEHSVTLGFMSGIDFQARRTTLAQRIERGE
jgi:NAD+ kinase